MSVAYDDFSVWIEPSPQGLGYCVRARCRAGEGSSPFQLPADLNPNALAPLGATTRDLGGPGASETVREGPRRAREIGGRLFQALLSGTVRQLYDRSLGAVPDPHRGLRLRLHLDPGLAPDLLTLPWELLYCPESRDHLGLNRLSPLVRYIEVPRAVSPPAFDPPLRVLLAPARAGAGNSLDLDGEMRLIREALQASRTEVEVLERTTLERLRERLLRGSFHVVHFLGHGSFERSSGTGLLQFESEDGREVRVSGEVLATHLNGCLPQLAVLNACNSGRTTSEAGLDAFAGVASSLVMSGVTAVVAMSSPVTDRAAIAFSKALYREIAAAEPVDAAVAEGRLAIYRTNSKSLEWATPMLFMRAPDGLLFSTRRAHDEGENPEAAPPSLDSISLAESACIEGDDVEIINQQGATIAGRPSAEIKIDGRIKAGRLTISNLRIEGQRPAGNKPWPT